MARRGARNRCSPLKKTDYCVEKAERKYVVWRFSHAQFSRRLHFFPKKRHSFGHSGSTFFVFFPRRRFETQETVPTGIVARLARGLARVGHSTLRKSRIQSASRERRKGPTEREFRVAKRRRARRERAFGNADGTDRLASRRVLEPRAFPGERRTSAGTGRATASSSLHRRTMMDAWKRETRGFSPACPGIG